MPGSSAPRFFVPPLSVADMQIAALPAEAAHHARNVLRLRPGEAVALHDGLGFAYDALLEEVSAKAVTMRITGRRALASEPRTRITIAQALPRTPDKVEQVLQHGTEAGAAGFVLFAGQRSVARLADGEKIDRRLQRWRGIVLGAAEQSGRGVLPDVAWVSGAAELTARFAGAERVLVLHEGATLPLAAALRGLDVGEEEGAPARLCVVVGPEGGLDAVDEVARFQAAGAVPVSLGPRVLRTETAALVAVAQILYALEPIPETHVDNPV